MGQTAAARDLLALELFHLLVLLFGIEISQLWREEVAEASRRNADGMLPRERPRHIG